jgi:hypothetical protein
VVLVGIAAMATASGVTYASGPWSGAAPGATASPAAHADRLTTYRDPTGRFTIALPTGWRADPAGTAGVAMTATGPDGGSMLIRVVRLGAALAPRGAAQLGTLTDALIGPRVAILQRRQITSHGATGYYYLYTFTAGRRTGLHAHYFLFRDRTLTMLVLQALPASSFQALAPQFDAIAGSLVVSSSRR